MPGTRVTEHQFNLDGDEVTHTPTGARFTAYPRSAEPHIVNWSQCGDVLPSGEDYYREDVQRVAIILLGRRLKK